MYNSACALNQPQHVYSITKSVTAALIGIAIDKRYIGGVEQTIADLLPGLLDDADIATGVREITLHQVLSMTSGQLWSNGAVGSEPMLARVLKQPDLLTALLRIPVKQSRVGQFQYSSGSSHLLSAILGYATNTTVESFAAEYLFSPLGIADYHWLTDKQGRNTGGWGLHLSPQDMAKFGQLILHRGQHQQCQLLPKQWILASTTAHTPDYGYQWWLKSSHGFDCWCAQGLGGQYICCVPALDTVIVTTAQVAGRRKNLWTLFNEHWIPALV